MAAGWNCDFTVRRRSELRYPLLCKTDYDFSGPVCEISRKRSWDVRIPAKSYTDLRRSVRRHSFTTATAGRIPGMPRQHRSLGLEHPVSCVHASSVNSCR